MLQKKLHFVL